MNFNLIRSSRRHFDKLSTSLGGVSRDILRPGRRREQLMRSGWDSSRCKKTSEFFKNSEVWMSVLTAVTSALGVWVAKMFGF